MSGKLPNYSEVIYKHLKHALAQAGIDDYTQVAGQRAGEFFSAGEDRFWTVLTYLLGESEGIVGYMYKDIYGHPTIGIGHLLTRLGPGYKITTPQTLANTLHRVPWNHNPSRALVEQDFERLRTAPYLNAKGSPYAASHFESLTSVRVTQGDMFKMVRDWALDKSGDFNYWGRTTRAFGEWRDLPFLTVAALFVTGWQHPATLTRSGGSYATAVRLREAVHQKRFFDASVLIAERSRQLHGGQVSVAEYNRRDMCRASAELFCKEECKNNCTNACPFKDRDPPHKPSLPVVKPQPPAPPTAETVDKTKFDQYIIQLRAWVPFARYPATDKGPLNAYSYKGDGHVGYFGDNEKPDDPAHRAMVTAVFDWHYREENGQKIGSTINPRTLDPVLGSDQRCAKKQSEKAFGKVVRFHTDAQNKWTTDASETFPPSAPDGVRVVWPEAGQNFTSLALQINTEYPQGQRTIPKLFGSLTAKFEGKHLVLDLTSTRFPSFGIRVLRKRNGKTEDLFGGWKTPVWDAKKEYEKTHPPLAPLPSDQGVGKAGPSQITDVTWLGNAMNEKTHTVSLRLDWTGAPSSGTAAPQELPTSGPPAPRPVPPAEPHRGLTDEEKQRLIQMIFVSGRPKSQSRWAQNSRSPLATVIRAALHQGLENRTNHLFQDFQHSGLATHDAYVARYLGHSVSQLCAVISHYLFARFHGLEEREFTSVYLDFIGRGWIGRNSSRDGWCLLTGGDSIRSRYQMTSITPTTAALTATKANLAVFSASTSHGVHYRLAYRHSDNTWREGDHTNNAHWGASDGNPAQTPFVKLYIRSSDR